MGKIENAVAALNGRGFRAEFLPDKEALFKRLTALLPEGAVIAKGGSVTLEELGVFPYLTAHGCRTEEKDLPATHFFTSTNALTESGYLVNTDGRGSRVSRMITGVPCVVVICGKNKIVKDTEAAVDRIRNVAAPKNCVRLSRVTPCAKTGRCEDCNSPDRICRATVIQTDPSFGTEMYVFILDMELGY